MSEIIIFDDLVAPVLTSPVDTKTGSSTANLSVSTNKDNGTLYWVVTTSATQPTAAQIAAGNDHTGSSAPASGNGAVTTLGTQEFAATGLSGSTLYYAHFMHQDVSQNQSAVASGDGFTTDSAGDTTAPVLTSPTDVAASSTTGTLGVTTDEGNGTLYWVVTRSTTAPSKAQVKAGQDHTGASASYAGSTLISSTGTKSKTATGLSSGTQYYMHAMHEDAATNQSTVVSGDGFLTTPATEVLTPASSSPWTIPDAAATYKLTVTVKGGGGGGKGGGGGGGAASCTYGPPPDFFCELVDSSGDAPTSGSNGTNGGQSVWNTTVTANGGTATGTNGTASGGNVSNTTGAGGAGGAKGTGGAGGESSCDSGSDGADGNNGGSGGRAIHQHLAGTLTPGNTIAFTVGSAGSGGAKGNGASGGGTGDCDDGGDGADGTNGSNGTAGSITLEWSL